MLKWFILWIFSTLSSYFGEKGEKRTAPIQMRHDDVAYFITRWYAKDGHHQVEKLPKNQFSKCVSLSSSRRCYPTPDHDPLFFCASPTLGYLRLFFFLLMQLRHIIAQQWSCAPSRDTDGWGRFKKKKKTRRTVRIQMSSSSFWNDLMNTEKKRNPLRNFHSPEMMEFRALNQTARFTRFMPSS